MHQAVNKPWISDSSYNGSVALLLTKFNVNSGISHFECAHFYILKCKSMKQTPYFGTKDNLEDHMNLH